MAFRELVRRVVRDIQVNESFERASGLAFDFLLALFPLLFILLAAFDLFASYSLQLRTDLLAYFADLLPTLAFQLLNRTTEELVANTSRDKLTIGIVVALWLVSTGVASIISSLNVAFRIRESRRWFKVRAIALALSLVISILILWALCIVLVSGEFVDWVGRELQFASAMIVFWKALQWPTAVVFVIFSYALIYHFGPNLPGRRWHWITPGSVFAAILWLAASLGFRIYLRFVNNYTVIFGSLGAAVILLVWLYVTGLAFLIGGEINATIERAAAQNPDA
ncbi:MAG TPA: YihY/virulence factor BrkB family protein [Candidatus Acidoferrales bacterium]|nr:YihY/virulence factor BrkB family protein [Candidatus Acidoferrales bacterium]